MQERAHVSKLLDDPFAVGVTRWLIKRPRVLSDISAAFGLETHDARGRLARLVRADLLTMTRIDTLMPPGPKERLYRIHWPVYQRAISERLQQQQLEADYRAPYLQTPQRLRGVAISEEALAHGALTDDIL